MRLRDYITSAALKLIVTKKMLQSAFRAEEGEQLFAASSCQLAAFTAGTPVGPKLAHGN